MHRALNVGYCCSMQQVIFYKLVDSSGNFFGGSIFFDFEDAISALNWFDGERLFVRKTLFWVSDLHEEF